MVRTRTQSRPQDSPSRQLMSDLARDLEQVRLHNKELKLVKAYERKSFYEALDRVDREREEAHNSALDAAAARREQLRREAEETLAAHVRAEEEARKRNEEQERLRKQQLERERAEKERREREEAERLETEKKAREEEEKRAAAARKAEEEENARRDAERAAADKKKQEEERRKAEAEEAKRKAAEKDKQDLEQQTFLGKTRRTSQEVAEHQRYVELHQHLKKFRKYMMDETKKNPTLKENMGNMRRSIKKCVGQLVSEGPKGANRTPTNEVISILKKALTFQELSVDVRQFIAFPPAHIADANDAQVPALMIYLLNIFSKAIIAQLIAEAGVTPKYAEPLGILTAQIFSNDPFLYRGYPMIDILLAKYHVMCPVLWGFYGSEKNDAGKTALGWWRTEPNGPFIATQLHEERMVGLGAGFAAIALRNFSKTPRENPYPNRNFWKALSYIVNVPPQEVQDTHVIVLTSMLRASVTRIINFWGDVGLAALKHAIVTFPSSLPRKSTTTRSLELLRDIYAREKNILI